MAITFLTNEDEKRFVKQVNGQTPDENGNVEIKVPEGGNGSGLTTAQINALDGLFKIAAYTEDARAEYAAFQSAFGLSGGEEPDEPDEPVEPEEPDEPDVPDEPEKTLTSISAVYSGGSVTAGTAVTDLAGIVVTAHYSDGTSGAVTGYTLSGTIAEGSNTITVSYGGFITTITVVGVAEETGAAQYAYTIVGTGRVTEQGNVEPMSQYDVTDFIDVDANYTEVTFVTYVDEASDKAMTSFCYAQWFNGDTFISRTGGGPTIGAGSLKGAKTHTMPEGATKFRVSVQNNCSRFALFKGTVTADEV